MTKKPYGMICPITRVCEILEPRWTIAILVALWAGASKFNAIRREIGSISPALLSKRLKELEELGLVERIADPATGDVDYIRTDAAVALEPALYALADWSQRYISAELALCSTSVSNLMWNMRKHVATEELPGRRVVIQLRFSDPGLDYDTWWLLMQPGAPVEVCTSIPGFDVDLYVETSIVSLGGIVIGRTSVAREFDLGELFVSGDARLARTIDRWLIPSPRFAAVEGLDPLPEERRGAPAFRVSA
ncbi:MAG: helix-turn-helix domain-containing protein [Pseudomonadota bacterium]